MIPTWHLAQVPTQDAPWPLPSDVEFRRMRNPAGQMIMVFSKPAVLAAGVSRGVVGVMEKGFDAGQLPLVLAMLDMEGAA